jgi:glucose/arabinose dehydrogenase
VQTFYEGARFPAEYRGSIFAAEHGSWNRSKPTGYKVIRVIVKDGVPTGEYEDFATGFVVDERLMRRSQRALPSSGASGNRRVLVTRPGA